MCNALSPEKAVIWTVLHDLALASPGVGQAGGVRREHFTHPIYQLWFDAAARLHAANRPIDATSIAELLRQGDQTMTERDNRALKRLLRVAPPPRIRNNAAMLAQALNDRHQGRRVHIERLIN